MSLTIHILLRSTKVVLVFGDSEATHMWYNFSFEPFQVPPCFMIPLVFLQILGLSFTVESYFEISMLFTREPSNLIVRRFYKEEE